MTNLVYGILYGTIGQILSFLQLQGSIKYGWHEKYLWIILLFGIPNMWFYLQSVNYIILHFQGSMWESRILGFCIGVVVFAAMGWILFSEGINAKTGVSLILALCIVLIQVLWR